METKNTTTHKRKLSGVVVSDKMQNTAVVLVERFVKNAKYQKYVQHRKRYKVHNEGNKAKEGDSVVIVETRPVSKHKSFAIDQIVSSPKAK